VDIGILLLIVFVLAPLLERLLAAGRPKAPPEQGPPQRRPRRGQAPQEIEDQPFRSIPPADADADEESAAAMLPDDLWEILTGEKRQPSRPAPPPEPVAGVPPEAAPREVVVPRPLDRRPVAARSAERPRRAEPPAPAGGRPSTPTRARRLPEVGMRRDPADTRMRPASPRRLDPPPDDFVRKIPAREAPAIVVFDEATLDPERRRAEFKARRALLEEAPTFARRQRRDDLTLSTREDLRRAIIMAEILGPPRGLQD
jgi:hypothetical protein